MAEILAIADLHLHHLPKWRLAWCEQFIQEMIDSYKQKDLFLLGDVFEVRNKIDCQTLNQFLHLCSQWQGDVYWITGQHDSYLPGRASVESLRGFNNITVIDKENYFCEKHNVHCVPFARDASTYRNHLEQVPNDSIVFTHIPTKEAIYQTMNIEAGDISTKEFKRFRRVLSGDIHKFYDEGNFSYIGAPGQRNWSDKNVDGQIGLFNLINCKLTRVPVKHPKHITVDSVSDIPTDGEYIIRCKDINKELPKNVISAVEVEEEIEYGSLAALRSTTPEELIGEYVNGCSFDGLSDYEKANERELLIKYGLEALK